MRCFERGYAKDKAFRNIYVANRSKGDRPKAWSWNSKHAQPSKCVVISVEDYQRDKTSNVQA